MRVVKQFDPEKGLPFWYLEFDGKKYGPFSTSEEALAFDDRECAVDGSEDDDKLISQAHR